MPILAKLDARYIRKTASFTVFGLCLLASTNACAKITKFTVKKVHDTIPYSINASDVIVGEAGSDGAFIRTPDGRITTFAVGPVTLASSINSAGVIVGSYGYGGKRVHGFIRTSNGTVTILNIKKNTVPESINDNGWITGQTNNVGSEQKLVAPGFVRDIEGNITTFGPQGSVSTAPFSINNNNDITGYFYDKANVVHGFVRTSDGKSTEFDAPGAGAEAYQGTFALEINDAGAIVGTYYDQRDAAHGFLREPNGTILGIDIKGALQTTMRCIDGSGDIAGYYYDRHGYAHSFLRLPDGTVKNFAKEYLILPEGINNKGDVTGDFSHRHYGHGFLYINDAGPRK